MSELNELNNHAKYAYLHRLSLEELLDLLTVAPVPAASPEKQAYVDALKEAIIEEENKNPTGFFPDVNQQWEQFVTQYLPDIDVEFECQNQPSAAQTDLQFAEVPPKRVHFKQMRRMVIAAAAAVACVFGIMLTAQAAGIDVFGAMARWTEDVFSFGQISPDSVISENPSGTAKANKTNILEPEVFSSLQEALDAYGITEVHEPTWLPEGYSISESGVEHLEDLSSASFYANYMNENDYITINIMSYEDEPVMGVQKVDAVPETLEKDGITFYLVENSYSCIVAWYDNEYEYYVNGMLNKDILWKVAMSMCE